MTLLVGDCLETLKTLPDNSVHAVICDPPYGIEFMGNEWDSKGGPANFQAWCQLWLTECYRVLKPGGHLVAFGGTRMYHRLACAAEDAAFEVRDSFHWVYGSGFPKSFNISKALDKAAGVEREDEREFTVDHKPEGGLAGWSQQRCTKCNKVRGSQTGNCKCPPSESVSDAAKQWDGWGTALKPSHEIAVVARKPLDGTIINNILTHGTGGINIAAGRIGRAEGDVSRGGYGNGGIGFEEGIATSTNGQGAEWVESTEGRFPTNTLLTHSIDCDETCEADCPVALLEAQQPGVARFYATSRWEPFYYTAKPNNRERDLGLDSLPEKKWVQFQTANGTSGKESSISAGRNTVRRNTHPTVKPLSLMSYLCSVFVPPGGTVLDPFLGSGTTAMAATLGGYKWIGCEVTPEYLPIIAGRIKWAEEEVKRAKQLELPL